MGGGLWGRASVRGAGIYVCTTEISFQQNANRHYTILNLSPLVYVKQRKKLRDEVKEKEGVSSFPAFRDTSSQTDSEQPTFAVSWS